MNNNFVFLQQSSKSFVVCALFISMMCAPHRVRAYILDLKQAILNSDVQKVQRIVFVEKLSQETKEEMKQLSTQVYEQAKLESEKQSWRHMKNWFAIIGSVWLIDKGIFLLRVAQWHSFTFYKDIINAHLVPNETNLLINIVLSNMPDRLAFLGVAGSGALSSMYGIYYAKLGITNSFVKKRCENAKIIRNYFV